jgi:hypothetical protein
MQPGSFAPNTAPSSLSPLPPAPPPGAASPFTLVAGRDDTALFQDARAGFSHLLPGRPALGLATLRPGDPPADATLHLQDAPITLRYRLEAPSFAASCAAELAHVTAERFAAWRAGAAVAVDRANETWLSAWGVEAAAVAAYDVPAIGGAPLGREDLFVLVRQSMVLIVSWTYPAGFVDDPAYATFASVAEATMVWDPARWEQRGRVWPEGAFLGPGLFGAPKAKYNELARQITSTAIMPEERTHALGVLSGVVSGAGAPWVPLAPEMIEGNKRAVLSAIRNARLRAFIEEAFADVRTAHDLRGLAIVLGRALDGRRTSSMPPPMSSLSRPPAPPRELLRPPPLMRVGV